MLSFLRRLLNPQGARRPTPFRRHARPNLELLETRLAPAVFNVNSLADILSPPAGVVTLRSAIQQANGTPGGNTINLTVASDYKITLRGTAGETDNAAGEFAIGTAGGNLTIVNTSGGSVVVDGNHLNRVFDVNPGNTDNPATKITVTMQGFTVANGLAQPGDAAGGSGGGVRDQGNASLTLTNMVVTGNTATADGGGVSMENAPASTPWTLTLNNTIVSFNHAGDAGGGVETDGKGKVFINGGALTGNTTLNQGAAVWLDATADGVASVTITNPGAGYTTAPTVTFGAPQNAGGTTATGTATITGGVVTNVTITNPGSGYTAAPTVAFSPPPAGIKATGAPNLGADNGASLTMTGTLVNDNTAENGPTGAIGNAGNGAVTISQSTIEYNFSGSTGGGFGDQNNLGSLNVSNSIFLGNSAIGVGGAIQEGGPSALIVSSLIQGNTSALAGGGVFANGVQLLLENSTVAGNTAGANPTGGNGGGGVEVQTTGTGAAASVIVNSTIAFNSALNNSGVGTPLTGGGIDSSINFTGTLTLLNDTINANFADEGGGVFWAGTGGSTVNVQNTIIAQNSASIAGPDADNAAGTFTDDGGNIIGISGAGSGNTGFTAATTQTGTVATSLDPLLGPLQFNGGPTVGSAGFSVGLYTEADRPHSPALDKGAAGAPANDERGFPRPDAAGEKPDVGAFESQVKENFVFVLNTNGSLTEITAGGSPTVLSPAGSILSIASVTNDAGYDVVFAVTSDSHLWEHSDENPGNGWEMLSSGSFLSISAAVNDGGDAIVAAVQADHSLWENSSLFAAGWQQLSPAGTIVSASAATDRSQGFPQEVIYAITVAGPDNLWRHTLAGWTQLSAKAFQSISAGFNVAGQAVVYAIGVDNSLTQFDPTLSGGSALLSPAGSILAASAGAAGQVFAITSDQHLWTHTTAGWKILSSVLYDSISGSATPTAGVGEVFGVLADGSLLEYNPAFGGTDFMGVVSSGVAAASAPQRY